MVTVTKKDTLDVQKLRANLRGQLIQRADKDYDQVRKVYNAMIDKRPAWIARCADVADVIECVNFARQNDLPLAIRGGGHSAAGLGLVDDGLVIDLSLMKGIRVDPDQRTVRLQGGCTLGEMDHATHPFGLATPSGFISSTGVGGLTLGGGFGYLTRKYGLTIDNLLSVDMVLADGSVVTASADENADLFWAVRGGGGNFGVVTSFLIRLHPVSTVIAGPTLWELDQAQDVMRWFSQFILQAPEELNGFFAFLTVPPAPPFPEHLHLKKMCGVVWCYAGSEDEADAVFEPIKNFGPPALFGVHALPYPALQSVFDGLYPPGLQWYWRSDFFKEVSDEAISKHLQYAAKLPTMHSTMHLYPINGAAHRIGKNDTAFYHRDANFSGIIAGVDPDPSNAGLIKSWTTSYWEALHPYATGGAYVNFLMDEGRDRIKSTYGNNYDRLLQIKRRYDPQNLFHVNQNIVA